MSQQRLPTRCNQNNPLARPLSLWRVTHDFCDRTFRVARPAGSVEGGVPSCVIRASQWWHRERLVQCLYITIEQVYRSVFARGTRDVFVDSWECRSKVTVIKISRYDFDRIGRKVIQVMHVTSCFFGVGGRKHVHSFLEHVRTFSWQVTGTNANRQYFYCRWTVFVFHSDIVWVTPFLVYKHTYPTPLSLPQTIDRQTEYNFGWRDTSTSTGTRQSTNRQKWQT